MIDDRKRKEQESAEAISGLKTVMPEKNLEIFLHVPLEPSNNYYASNNSAFLIYIL